MLSTRPLHLPSSISVVRSSMALACITLLVGACGGGGGGGSNASSSSSSSSSSTSSSAPPYAKLAALCAAPRPKGTTDPVTGLPYNDKQGSLLTENQWIASYVNDTYLWYQDVPVVNPAPYVIGATVPYVDPTTNAASTETVTTNYEVVSAYFNSQRSPLFTASGKPKDQFHYTYVTSDYDALEQSGQAAGYGFTPIVIAATPPRSVVVGYTDPNTPATSLALPIARGAQILDVDGVDVVNGSDVDTINEGLFSPAAGEVHSFTILDEGATTPRTVSLTASIITETPVQNVGALPSPYNNVGYMLFNEHIATAESELIAAVTQLGAANGGAGIKDLVIDMRYNGGGLLDIASELASMVSSAPSTSGVTFEQESFNDKNPFAFTTAEATTPFYQEAQGFSSPPGTTLPHLNLTRVFVISTGNTCSASEAVINGLRGVGVQVILIGGTTCGKPYGFFPQDNCSTTYFTIQFQGVNALGFGAYADGFIPGGTGTTANNLPGCVAKDDYSHALGDPNETSLAAALTWQASGTCPAVTSTEALRGKILGTSGKIVRPLFLENRILHLHPTAHLTTGSN
jgi:C-terminal processing protease CtpA/Prc